MTELGVEGDGNDVEIGAREKVLEGKLPLLHRLSKYFGFNIPAASKSEDTDPQ